LQDLIRHRRLIDRVGIASGFVQRTCIKDSYSGQACKVTSAKL